MTIVQYLNYLRGLGIKLWMEGDKLRFRAPQGALTDELRAELTERKPEVIRFLRQFSEDAHASATSIPRAAREGQIPLSFAQQRLWFLDQLQPGSTNYSVCDAIPINRSLDVKLVQRALNELVKRHEILRTSFPSVDGVPTQLIHPPSEFPLQVIDVTSLPEEERMPEAWRIAVEESKTPFNLATGPLLRVKLVRLGEAKYFWLLSIHHIISDDWSKKILDQELEKLYAAYSAGQELTLPELPIQWADFALWQNQWLQGEVLESHVKFWAEQLSGDIPTLNLPADRLRGQGQRGANGRFSFPRSLSSAIKRLSETEGATTFMVAIAGYAALLSRYTGQDEVIIGSPISDRNQVETEGLIGFLLNTLSLRVRFENNPTFREVLAQVRETCLGAYAHQEVPYESLMQRLHVNRDSSGSPLFQTMIALLNTPKVRRESSAFWGERVDWDGSDIENTGALTGAYIPEEGNETTKFDLSLTLIEYENGYRGRTEYNADLFDQETVARLIERFQLLLHSAAANPDLRISELAIMTEEQRNEVLTKWSSGESAPLEFPCLHQLFERQAAQTPSAAAVECGDESLTYAELNAQANQLARKLIGLGVGPEKRVGIFLENSCRVIVAMLAVMKAGGAYVPLDPLYPKQRLELVLADAGMTLLLTQKSMLTALPAHSVQTLCLDREWANITAESAENLPCEVSGDNQACVLFTSGSTGRPKGVILTHKPLANYAQSAGRQYEVTPNDRVLQFASVAFDASLEEIHSALATGATLVMRPVGMIDSIESFLAGCREMRLTTLVLPTAYWHELVSGLDEVELPPTLRTIIIGGERALPEKVARWQKLVGDRVLLFNTYGPTEGTIVVTRSLLPGTAAADAAGKEVSIGMPIENCSVYVIDQWMQAVPPGIPGELCLGGVALARGYLNQPGLTAEKFIPDPFSATPGARMYRTGDLVRFLPDGTLEYRGRIDHQVKIRGYRVELGEIETRLAEYPSVSDVVVIAREETAGDKRLVAYYTCDGDEATGAEQLRPYLSASLPDYMVPSAYVRMDRLPLTPNGKLDRKALPAPDSDSYMTSGYEPPQGEIETKLAAIWAEVLKVERVGRHDNFFSLGGHSLLAVTLIERMRRNGLKVNVRMLFATSNLADLAASVDAEAPAIKVPENLIPAGCEAITPEMLPLVELTAAEIEKIVSTVPGGAANVQDIYPLAPLQEGILFHHLMGAEGDAYLIANQFSFASRERLDDYIRTLQAVIDRHDILRTAVQWEELPEPVQVVWRKAPLLVEEIEVDPAAGDISEQLRARFSPRNFRIDVRQAPLMRLYLAFDKANNRWLMMRLVHHLTMDHTTVDVIESEVQAHLLGKAGQLSAPQPYRNLVAQVRLGISKEEHETFFRKMLGDVDEPTAPFGLMDVQGDGRGIEEAYLAIDDDLSRRLRASARRMRVSVASLCHLAWAQVLAKVSGREDVVFGTVLFGRMQGGEGSERGIGLFINTLPVRIGVGGESVDSCVRRTHTVLADLMRHEHASLALAQRCSAVQAPAPLFSALFNYRHSADRAKAPSAEALKAWDGIEGLRGGLERTNYPITLEMDDLGEGFGLNAQTPVSIGPMRVCEFMRAALESLAEALETSPAKAVRELNVLPASERDRVLYEWNNTRTEFPADQCVHQLFEEQVLKTPEATAVVYEGEPLSYAELNARANQLAHYLRELGVKPDARVAICVERGLDMIVALLAVLKAGGAYVPLDPNFPVERQRYMLQDSAPVALLTQGHLRETFAGLDDALPVLDLAGAERPWQKQPKTNPDPCGINGAKLTTQRLAYVIYTSGSTGNPKGVMIDHVALTNFLCSMQEKLGIGSSDTLLAVTTFSFDIAALEFYLPLTVGARLIMMGRDASADGARLVRELESGVTMMQATPTSWRMLVEAGWKGTEGLTVLCGGEALPANLAQDLIARCSSVWNMYGPTETTIWSLMKALDRVEDSISIGRPIANTQLYILDPYGRPVPVGVTGELYIGGTGVARGYLNRPELTAERFVADPFSSEPEARMYKTGDLGRWLADGEIEFLGRNDFQVKIRGYRIELGEIEARLAEHAAVRDAVVIAREDTPGDKRLVAYFTCAVNEEDALGAEQLRPHLLASLPEYMVPSAYVRMERLPQTPNGKLDRKALPAPDGDAYATRGYEPPQGEIERALAAVWAEVLKLELVGRHDNFFELGGHSLLAVRAVTRLRQALSVELAIRDLFAHPVLADLARALESASRAVLPAITPANRSERLPLSFAQQRLWFLSQMEGISEAYHLPVSLLLKGDLNRTALHQALDRIVLRHEGLRTRFAVIDGEPMQKIVPANESRFALLEHDLRQSVDIPAELRRLVALDACSCFDLEAGPLIRGRLIRLAEDEHALLITMHHIVSDGWSMGILANELSALYSAYLRGEADPLPMLAIQYADYAVWQRQWIEGEILAEQSAYWKKTLAGAPALLELPLDHPRPAQQEYTGAFAGLALDEQLTAALVELGRRHGATLYMTLLSAWALLLARLSGQQDVVIGSPVANRGRAEIENLIGFFVNTLALRIDLSGSPSVSELLGQVREQAIAAQQHQDIPFEQVVEVAQPARSLAHSPLFQVMFAWGDAAEGPLELPGLEVSGLESDSYRVSKFDLTLHLQKEGERIAGGIEYATSLFERATIERYLGYFQDLLQAMVANATQSVYRLPMLGEAERDRVLHEWNDTAVEYPDDKCMHELFEEQVLKSPDATALVFEDESLSYAELNRRANRLAHHLRDQGVKPDSRVAICCERGFEMIVALFGVLKAGGAYVPLDPAYPVDRLRFMLEDSAPVALLTQGHLKELFTGIDPTLPVLDLMDQASPWQEQSESNIGPCTIGLTPQHLAYIIYTSGSTGLPKGTMISHGGAANTIQDINAKFAAKTADRILALSSFSFDLSVYDIFGMLAIGSTIVIPPPDKYTDAAKWQGLIRRHGVTIWNSAPPLMQLFVDSAENANAGSFDSVRLVMLSGDWFSVRLSEQIRKLFPSATIYSLGGATEASIWSTHCHVSSLESGRKTIPYGKPLGNQTVYVLNKELQPCPVGVHGELYIGGVGVALGYLNRPELTSERFLPDPFATDSNPRMYKTGDMVHWLPDGSLEFLGRNDFQVKIRGFRIELGEIEARLMEHPAVREAVVIAREDTPGDKRLVAYYTASLIVEPEEDAVSTEQLRSHLSSGLPEYMVPSAYVRLESLPLTPNGKLDRKALPAPDGDAYATRGYEPPQGETEAKMAVIWAGVLKLEQVGRHDNFFQLGGHSLLAVQVVGRLNEAMNVSLPLRRLFEAPTIAELALVMDELSQSGSSERSRITSLRSLMGTASSAEAHEGEGLGAPENIAVSHPDDIDRMLSGLENMTEQEILALLGDENEMEAEDR